MPPSIRVFLDIVSRAQAVILRSMGEALAITHQQTGVTPRHVRNLYNEAQQRSGILAPY